MSKGSKPRPLEIPREKFNSNWDAIFKKAVQPEPSQPVRSPSEGSGDEMGEDEVGAGV